MKRSSLLTVFAIILGLIGAYLRAEYLLTGFEADSGLPLRTINPYRLSLLILSVCVLLIFLLSPLFFRKTIKNFNSRKLYQISGGSQVLYRVLSAFFMFLSAVIGIYDFLLGTGISVLIIALLSLISGAGLISLTIAQKRDSLSDEHLICAAAPVFWTCFMLIYFYREHSADPVFGSYSYELFAIMASMLAIFFFAGIFFSRPYFGHVLVASSFAVYMVITAYGGRVLYNILSAASYDIPAFVSWFSAMLAILLLAIANGSLLTRVPKH